MADPRGAMRWEYPKRWSTTQWWDDPNIRGWQRKWVLGRIELEDSKTIKETWLSTTQIRMKAAADPRPLSAALVVAAAPADGHLGSDAQHEPEHENPRSCSSSALGPAQGAPTPRPRVPT